MRIAIGSDHGGKRLREAVFRHLRDAGHEVVDHGTERSGSVDYAEYGERVARSVAAGEVDCGVLVCGTGIGMSMAANRVAGVRAALCTCEFMARATRAHNDANVLCLGERVLGEGAALCILDLFLSTSFEGGRHARRIEQLAAMEQKRA